MDESAANPYRSSGPLADLPELPSELVYSPGDRPRRAEAMRRAAGVIWLGALTSAFVGALFFRLDVGALVFAGFVAGAVLRWKRTRFATRIVLRVEEGQLLVQGASRAREALSLPLSRIRNVRLETKTIEKLQTDRTIGALIVATSIRPAIDVSRVVVVPAKSWGGPFALDAEYEPNFEAVEWLGKIRRFLRAYGWVPADERGKKGDAPDHEAETRADDDDDPDAGLDR
jgi:hypothetical protein